MEQNRIKSGGIQTAILLTVLFISCLAAHKTEAHPGGLDGSGCHKDGKTTHCHESASTDNKPTNIQGHQKSTSGNSNFGILLLEASRNTQEDRPAAAKSESQKHHDSFMKAFDRNRFKTPDRSEQVQKTGHADNYKDENGILRDGKTGQIHRSETAKNDFKRQHPCPSTGKTSGTCPGYVIDHVKALKHGGADDPSNMQWQTIAEGKAKDKWE